ncbi:MAG: alpha-glucosidase [Cyclobacteriaceae bacterium]
MKYPFIMMALSLTASLTQCDEQKRNVSGSDRAWWKEEIIYQIYPRSFKDSDGDGVGDLRGIIQKLDYIKDLGVTAVWLNPIYSSPNDDNGYDVSDYRGIMRDFGTMADFDEMLEGMHARGIKLVMDMVLNHSSDEHEWFRRSRSSRDNPYRDYYHWWPAEKGKPPYRYSLFDEKGDAWKYDSATNAYYLHYFSVKQPDLNWENPKVRQEVYDIMRFWADKGVDGFRLDAFQFAAKDTAFPEFPNLSHKNFIEYYAMQPGLHEYLQEMNREVFSKYKVMTVAEGAGRNFEDAHNLVDADRNELQMAYAFDAVDIAKVDGYDLGDLKKIFSRWDSAFASDGWLSIFLANHDQARLVSRFGNDRPEFRIPSAKMLNTFILSMRGTPYCYYGDELGMTNLSMQTIEEYKDIAAINGYKKVVGEGGDVDEYMRVLRFSSRDNGRTPMQWNDETHAGFTTGTPWLPVNENYRTLNVAVESGDPNSVLNHFKAMVALRKARPVLIYGEYQLVQPEHPAVYAYTRALDGVKALVLLNFTQDVSNIELPKIRMGSTWINNYEDLKREGDLVLLQPYQAVIVELE